MKCLAALGAAALLVAPLPARAQPAERAPHGARPPARRGAGRAELGLRGGGLWPMCDGRCASHLGLSARIQFLFSLSRVFKVGASVGLQRLSYLDQQTTKPYGATAAILLVLFRAYPVMGRHAGLYFGVGFGGAMAVSGDPITGPANPSRGIPRVVIDAGVPIVAARWLRIGPYVAAASGPPQEVACVAAPGPEGGCATEPAHNASVGLGVEAMAVF